MSQTFNHKKIFIAIIILLLALLAGLLFFIFSGSGGSSSGGKSDSDVNSNPSKYSAVYLKTGDVYFGKLSWFPRLKLENPWFLQKIADAKGQPQISVAPLADAFWKPINEIYLNKDEIVFWTRLRIDSQVIPLLSGEAASQPQTPP